MRIATRVTGGNSAGLAARLGLITAGLVTACSFAYWAEYSFVPEPSLTGIEGVMLTGEMGGLMMSGPYGAHGLCLKVRNARHEPVRILWDGAWFIDLEGAAFPVLPGDMAPDTADPSSTVPGDSTYEKFVLPSANRLQNLDASQHWWKCGTQIRYTAKALVPDFGSSVTRGGVDRKAGRLVGRTLGFIIPVRAGASEVTYRLFFKIDGYRIGHFVDF